MRVEQSRGFLEGRTGEKGWKRERAQTHADSMREREAQAQEQKRILDRKGRDPVHPSSVVCVVSSTEM